MKKSTKFFSVILCISLFLSYAGIAASAETCNCPNDPIIYVYGKHEVFKCDDNGEFILDDSGEHIKST